MESFWHTPQGKAFWKRLKPAADRLLNNPKSPAAYGEYAAIEREIAQVRTGY